MAEEHSLVLTVAEAGAQLRISRSLAYQLARRYVETGGREGLPVIKLGRRMVVPRHQFDRLVRGELAFSAITPSVPSPHRPSEPELPPVSHAAQFSRTPAEA